MDGTFIYPKKWNNTAVLWLSLKGEESRHQPERRSHPRRAQAARRALCHRLPEALPAGRDEEPERVCDGKRKLDSSYEGFAGYHYGYNPSLSRRAAGDALAMIAMIRDNEKHRTDRIIVAGVEGAGVIAAAATALAGSAVNELVTDLEGFRFAKLTDVWDVNFVPGAEKYGDVPGIIALCSAKTSVLGEKGAAGADAVAQAVGGSEVGAAIR